ncbi:hypothetical protein ACHAO8_011502 [Botrytis cinerea]
MSNSLANLKTNFGMILSNYLSVLAILLPILVLATCLVVSTYNLYFHPISSYPGPRLWAISRFPYVVSLYRGRLHIDIKEIHNRYGPVVRIAPDELSFIEASAWSGIYTGGVANQGFIKHKAYSDAQGFESLFDASDENHARLRKLLGKRFFAAASANKQEEVIQSYSDILIKRLKEQVREVPIGNQASKDDKKATESGVINLQEWYNYTTFDIAGKFTPSEDFGCLEGSTYHPWILMVLTHFKMSALVMALRLYTPLDVLFVKFAPARFLRLKHEFLRLTREKFGRRLSKTYPTSQDDFVVAIFNDPKSGGVNRDELEANCILMILAGSETMATSLLSATNFLCKSPQVLQKLTEEIRQYDKEGDLKLTNLNQLPYLNAVIRETHRVCPPLANAPARVVGPGSAMIGGRSIPPGTAVGVTQYAAFHSPTNFALPTQFIPERWLKIEESERFAGDNRDVMRPFSVGGRDCAGQNIGMAEFRVVLARVIWNFDISAVSTLAWEDQKCFMLWQKDPFFVNLKSVARDV